MQRKFCVFSGLMLVATLLVVLPGSGQSASAYLDDLDPTLRAAASSVLSQAWALSGSTSNGTLFGVYGKGTMEARFTGFNAIRQRMLATGDPALGVSSSGNAQLYADAALSGGIAPEYAYARAAAAIVEILNGFAIVPGGPSEAFNRVQTCMAGNIQTNQGNLVNGVALECGYSPVRLAVANQVATGWYVQFGSLVGFGCNEMAAQATGGPNSEARWAAANAWILSGCGSVADAANSGGSAELRAAAVAPLAQQLAGSGSSAASLYAASRSASSGSFEYRRAHALAAGLVDQSGSFGALGNLFQDSLSNAQLASADAFLAPLARYLAGDGTLTLHVYHKFSRVPMLVYSTVKAE